MFGKHKKQDSEEPKGRVLVIPEELEIPDDMPDNILLGGIMVGLLVGEVVSESEIQHAAVRWCTEHEDYEAVPMDGAFEVRQVAP